MYEKAVLLTIIFVVSIVLALAFGYLNYRYKRRTIDYYVMFIVGIAWTVLGIVFKITFLMIVGAIFSLWGYIKRDEWEEDLSKFRKANREELYLLKEQTGTLEIFLGIIIFIGALVLIGIIAYLYYSRLKNAF